MSKIICGVILGNRANDLSGNVFGRLTVLHPIPKGAGRHISWWCVCECGKGIAVQGNHLAEGNTNSCGCLAEELRVASHTTHGQSRSPTYQSWDHMLQRCCNSNSHAFRLYGGRNIKVCDRWKTFELFLEDMGERPNLKLTIDRFPDKDGDYEPGNCRWASKKQQGTLAEWHDVSGTPYSALLARFHRGWPAHDVIWQPIDSTRKLYDR